MADFFGGILDDLQGTVTDVGSFFDSVLGSGGVKKAKNAAAEAVRGGYGEFDRGSPDRLRELSVGGAGANVTRTGALVSEDFSAAEIQWINRMRRFSSLDTDTEVRLGR